MPAPHEVLQLAEQGARVTPLAHNSKKPILKQWHLQNNSSELTQVEHWANIYPSCNWGMVCGPESGRWVLDFDCKKGKHGLVVLQNLIEEHGPEWTYTQKVRTPSGGLHLYFPWQDGLRHSLGMIAQGVDVQAKNTFVVVPPSVIDGHAYCFEDSDAETDLAQVPKWLWQKVTYHITVRARKTPMDAVYNEKLTIAAGDRHRHLLFYLIRLRERGASKEYLRLAALEFNRRFDPPYDEFELERQIDDVVKRF
jgi:hypothetical protein